jgi:hypothetical protein
MKHKLLSLAVSLAWQALASVVFTKIAGRLPLKKI